MEISIVNRSDSGVSAVAKMRAERSECASSQDLEGTLLPRIRRWVEIETPSGNRAAIAALVMTVSDEARSVGLATEMQEFGTDVGPMLVVTNRASGDDRAGILILAHTDTVHPIGTLLQNPFRVECDRVYGPGGYDMKAGACVALAALEQVHLEGSSRLPIDMVFVPDEEIGSSSSRAEIERLARGARYTLVAEPARAGGNCVTARKGIGGVAITARGCAAHAGTFHHLGRNAIRELAHQVLALEAMTDYERGITVNVGQIHGGTGNNVVPETCRLSGEFRSPTAELANDLRSRLESREAAVPGVSLHVETWISRPPYEKSKGTESLLAYAQNQAASAGFILNDVPMTGGGSDGNFTAALGIPTLDGLGVLGEGAHTLHEYFLLSSLRPRFDFWVAMLRNLK